MRFVFKIDNQNIGFTESELLILNKKKHIHPQNVFEEFLKKAGKKSNVFDTNFKDVNEYIDFQIDFESRIKNDSEISLNLSNICCFYKESDYYGNTLYYFIKTEKAENQKVFYYSNETIPIGVSFKDDRVAKIGLVDTKKNFVEFINYKTEFKFGKTIGKKILTIIWTILTFPIWLPILISLEIKKRF